MKPQRKAYSKIYNPVGFGIWKRRKQMAERADEVRGWSLTCRLCGHTDAVEMTLGELRAAGLSCSECSHPFGRRA